MKHLVISALALGTLFAGQSGVAQAAPPNKMQQAKAKENKADETANVSANREVIQGLEHCKKVLEAEKGKDMGAHRANAIKHIQAAMGEIRSNTSKPGH